MATLNFLVVIAVLAVGAQANFGNWQPFQQNRMPMYWPFPNNPFPPFPAFPTFPPIQMPKMPTPDEIRNTMPGPGQVYSGVVASSSSGFYTDKDGKVVKTGGTSILTNNNGDVKEFTAGDSPPNINEPIVMPPMLNLEFPEFPKFRKMEPLKFDDFEEIQFPKMPKMKKMEFPEMPTMKPFKMPVFEPIDPEKIKTYVPKEGETFVGSSSSSFSQTNTVNGKSETVGGSDTVVNNNGQAKEKNIRFHKGDKGAE